MGRREDGAAVREGRRYASNSPGRPSGETPPSIDAAPRVWSNALQVPGRWRAPLAGTTTCRQELADRRGWSTFSEARPDQSLERRCGAPGGASLLRKGGDAFAKRPTGWLSPATHRGFRNTPASAGAPLPSKGSAMRGGTRACPGPTKEHGRWRVSARSLRKAGIAPPAASRRPQPARYTPSQSNQPSSERECPTASL